jgi:putative PEP-CTERM system histidine kinase
MAFSVLVAFGGAVLSGGLSIVALCRGRRSLVDRLFAVGMLVFAVDSLFAAFYLQAASYDALAQWFRFKWVVASLLPGTWLLFSLCYGRENYREFVQRWKWGIVCAFAVPISLAIFGAKWFFVADDQAALLAIRGMRLGWSGYGFCLVFLLAAVAIVAVLERTLRASYAKMRWRMKFMILGVGGLFAMRIYTASQNLLFSLIDSELMAIDAAALATADLVIIAAFLRSHLRDVSIYVSPTAVRNSLTVLIVGVYLLVIGLSAKLARVLGTGETLLQNAFFVFLAAMGMTVIVLSEQLRNRLRRFLARHFRQPLYDYRRLWTVFTQRTNALFDLAGLCSAVVNTVAETFGCSAVSIWVVGEVRRQPQLTCSTFLSQRQMEAFTRNEAEVMGSMPYIRNSDLPQDLHECDWFENLRPNRPSAEPIPEDAIRYMVPLAVGTEFLGLMTLNERMTGDSLTIEDLDLLKTIGDQTAALLLNCSLYDRLGQAKEKEAFQTLSAFFVHDLKNLASSLSLTLQSLPVHYDNPDFRSDMMRVIAQSLKKLDSLCSGLAAFRDQMELQLEPTDLGELVAGVVAELDGSLKATLIQDLQPVSKLPMDRGQMQKVLVNLLLNANEATRPGGEIRVMTRQEKDHVALVVSDNGCGMSSEFIRHSLFRPFKTTKDQGLGIGMYQSKMIVEAHQGRVEVESEEGRGSVFRVLLPIGKVIGSNG